MIPDLVELTKLYTSEFDPGVAAADVPRQTVYTKEKSDKPLEDPTVFPLTLWQGHEGKRFGVWHFIANGARRGWCAGPSPRSDRAYHQ